MTLSGGNLIVHSTFNIDGGLNTGIGDGPAGLNSASVVTAYPNPSSGLVSFRFTTSESSKVILDVLSMNGTLVSRVFEGYVAGSVENTIRYDSNLPQGIYFYRLQSSTDVLYGKLVVTSEQ
jgi:hypothetical protein